MGIFGPKPWASPVGKMSIFRLSELLVLIAQTDVFSFQNIVKDILLAYIAYKKKVGKMAIFGPNHGLTTFEKCEFLDFLNFLILQLRKVFFRSRILLKIFSWPILPKKKKLEKVLFLGQNNGLTPLEKCEFLAFLNFLILQLRKVFFVLEYR